MGLLPPIDLGVGGGDDSRDTATLLTCDNTGDYGLSFTDTVFVAAACGPTHSVLVAENVWGVNEVFKYYVLVNCVAAKIFLDNLTD